MALDYTALLVALLSGGLFGALGGFVGALSQARSTAKKADLDVLRDTINELQEELATERRLRQELEGKVSELRQENQRFRTVLLRNGIDPDSCEPLTPKPAPPRRGGRLLG